MAEATPCWPAPVSAMIRVLAHPLGEQDLAKAIVDLVGAGMVEFIALEIDFCAAKMLGQALGEIQAGRAPV